MLAGTTEEVTTLQHCSSEILYCNKSTIFTCLEEKVFRTAKMAVSLLKGFCEGYAY